MEPSASKSDSLPLTKFSESLGCSHMALSAARTLAIQPSPAQAAVARPAIPRLVREAIAVSIKLISWLPTSPEMAPLMRPRSSAIVSGRRDSTNPMTAKATIMSGNSAKTVKYVIPAAKKLPFTFPYRSCMRMMWSNQGNLAR
ncbi:Uncharacterised protein [Mycobacteroides abscessus subsp. abscessus]|nr:Uncharacterised protein [Mycobacteroides abscessus subsp. abscessus]